MKNIFSTGIDVYNLKDINNEKMVEYAEQNSLRGKEKETADILKNNLFSKLNNVVEEKMNVMFNKIYNDKYYIKLDQAWANVDAES